MGVGEDRPAICPVIAGPTAVGKTGLILALAARHPIEVVSLDSRQIYRGLRIGTAQPTAEEQAACPHHLVDFLPPSETYSSLRFRDDFIRVAREIHGRGRVPLLVGGAGLYLTAVQDGFFPVPDDAPDLAGIRSELDGLDDAAVRERLRSVDAASWERIHPHDRYRSQRALEIHLLTGRTMTEIRETHVPDPALGLSFPLVVLDRDRVELRARIAARTDEMLAAGWIDETRDLLAVHGAGSPGLQTLGYRELLGHLISDRPLAEVCDRIVIETARYAKRQRTWFRTRQRAAGGHPDDPRLRETVEALLQRAAG